MKRRAFAVVMVVAMLAFAAPLFAADDPSPPTGGTGGCSSPDCK